jgi:hypothetical protein
LYVLLLPLQPHIVMPANAGISLVLLVILEVIKDGWTYIRQTGRLACSMWA